MPAARLILAFLTCLAVLTPAQAQEPRASQRFEFTALHMGVKTRIILYSPDEESARTAAAAAFDRIAELESIMSDYRPDSELSLLPARAAAAPAQVTQDLFAILERSQHFAQLTGGAFDITMGPLTKLWRTSRASGQLPTDEQLAAARAKVGWQKLTLDPGRRTAHLTAGNMQFDLGGIAKGYAAQQASNLLRSRGHTQHLVSLSGDIVLADPPPGEPGWRIACPAANETRELLLHNTAISTSGDSEQFIAAGAQRYSHIIDPRTGLGSTSRLSATVIANDGATADALGTCLSLLGPAAADQLLSHFPGAAAQLIDHNANPPLMHATPGFPASRQPAPKPPDRKPE